MNCEPTSLLAGHSSSSIESSSPQPLPLTISNSSRCTSPISSPQHSDPSEQNGIESPSYEDESISGINLTMNKSNLSTNSSNSSSTNNGSIISNQHNTTNTISKRPSLTNHNHHHINLNISSTPPPPLTTTSSFDTNNRNSHKMKISPDFPTPSHNNTNQQQSQRKSKSYHHHPNHRLFDNNNLPIMNMNSPDLTQLLLEYRQVLLDVLIKSMKMNDNHNEDTNNNDNNNNDTTIHKGIVLPVKCQCGYTSELSKQITRTSTYVHQLELKFRAFLESMKATSSSTESNRYTPKRPWFIDSSVLTSSYPLGSICTAGVGGGGGGPTKVSLLDKKIFRMSANDKPISLFSGNSSMNSSLNDDDDDDDDDDDIDSDVGGDVDDNVNDNDNDEDNLLENLNNNNNLLFTNGANPIVDEIIGSNIIGGGGKTILEGYLKKMNEMTKIHIDDCSDDDNGDDDHHLVNKNDHQQQQQVDDEEEPDGVSVTADEDFHRGMYFSYFFKSFKIICYI